jgi:hypothetical protein
MLLPPKMNGFAYCLRIQVPVFQVKGICTLPKAQLYQSRFLLKFNRKLRKRIIFNFGIEHLVKASIETIMFIASNRLKFT